MDIYLQRQRAINLLSAALESLPIHLTQEDGAIDAALRIINGQPRRQVHERYYASINTGSLISQRERAINLLRSRLLLLDDHAQALDSIIDALVRTLYGMSEAKENLYEGFPTPEEIYSQTAGNLSS
jgi:hypothetical protein